MEMRIALAGGLVLSAVAVVLSGPLGIDFAVIALGLTVAVVGMLPIAHLVREGHGLNVVLALAGLTVTWLIVRAGPLLIADAFIVAAVPVAAGRYRGKMPSDQGLLFLGIGLIVCGASAANLLHGGGDGGIVELLTFIGSTILPVFVVGAFRGDSERLTILVRCYVAGVTISVITSFFGQVTYSGRWLGLASHPNHMGISALLALGPAAGLMMYERTRLGRAGAALAVAMTAAAVLNSGSRAALVGASVAGAAFAFSVRRIWVYVLVVAAVLVAFGAVSYGLIGVEGESALARLLDSSGTAQQSDLSRNQRYEAALEAFDSSPLVGIGFENARAGHSVYLQILASSGVVGLVGLILVIFVVASAWVKARAEDDPIAAGVTSSAVAFFVTAIASNQLWDRYIWFAFGLCVALTANTSVRLSALSPNRLRQARQAVRARR